MTSPPRILRPAQASDCDHLAAIHATAFAPQDAWSATIFSLQLGQPNVFGLLQPDAGLIVLRIAADEAEILTLAVTPARRRSGVGRSLLHEAMIRLAAAEVAVLFLEVSVNNTAALLLYTRTGFVRSGLRPRYYSDGSDALVLRADVPHPGLSVVGPV